MSKKNNKKKTQELPPIPKYQNENLIEDLSSKFRSEETVVQRLQNELFTVSKNSYDRGKEYILGTKAVEIALEQKTKENAFLNEEIMQIRKDREDFEAECKRNFEEKFAIVEAEQKAIVAKVNEEMSTLKENLETEIKTKNDLIETVNKLNAEVLRLNDVNTITVQNYEKKIIRLKDEYYYKLKATTEIFENFLKNNKELLTTDIYTVYCNLKQKFNSKIKECLDYKDKNSKLLDENKIYKISINNSDDIINECAKAQVEHKKKNKALKEEIDEKNKLICKIKEEYQKQVDTISEKFDLFVQEKDNEVKSLKNELTIKKKEYDELRTASQLVLKQRSEMEVFFIDMLKDVKKEIALQRKREYEKNNSRPLLPYINVSQSYAGGSSYSQSSTEVGKDDSIYITSLKKVDIKDIDAESKEKIIRALLNKINDSKNGKNILRLKQALV